MLKQKIVRVILVVSAVVLPLISAVFIPGITRAQLPATPPITPPYPICRPNETLVMVSPCQTGSNYRNYNLKNTNNIGQAFFVGRKLNQNDGWFLFGENNTQCGGTYLFRSITVHPTNTTPQLINVSSQIKNFEGKYMKIVNYKNTEFGYDNTLYLCKIVASTD